MTFCKNCGAKLNPQDEFCPNCGTKNETPQQPQQPDGMGADAVTAVPGGKKPFLETDSGSSINKRTCSD